MKRFMRRLVAALLIIVLVSVVSAPQPATAQAGALAVGTAMNGVVDNLRESIKDILDKLDDSVSSGTFLVRMQLQNLLTELDYHTSAVVDKTFGQLDQRQQAFFRNAQQTIEDLDALGDNLAENADDVVKQIAFTIASVPFTAQEPRLRSHGPRAITISTAGQDVKVSFDGMWLAHADPTLKFGSTYCTLADLDEPKATFQCPSAIFAGAVPKGITYLNGQFAAAEEQGFWASLFSDPDTKTYPVSIAVVQDVFGLTAIQAKVASNVPEIVDRSQRWDTGREHCVGRVSRTVNVSVAGPEWTIVPESIKLEVGSSSRGTRQLNNVTPVGFQLRAEARNSGSCVRNPLGGGYISYDARGWDSGTIRWREQRSVLGFKNEDVFKEDLRWGDTKVALLPERTESYLVSVTLFNGVQRQYNAPGKDEFFILERDDANGSLKLAPRPIQDAFK
jgi:hypothetical protein